MSEPSVGTTSPSVKLSPRYLFTDDAIADAMQLVTALTQLGQAERVKDAIGGIMRAKRAVATEKWTRTAESEFWTSYAQLAQAARAAKILNGPPAVPVQPNSFLNWLRKVATFPGAMVVALALVVMLSWLWAKTLAETVDNDRANLQGCLVAGSEKKTADAVAPAIFGDPTKPASATATRPTHEETLASCAHILAALEDKLAKVQGVASLFLLLPGGTTEDEKRLVNAKCAGSGDNAVFCQWMFAYNSPANDALGRLVMAVAMLILPPLLGALGAWAYTVRRMIRDPAADMTRSRLSDRKLWLNMMFGAMLGSGFALWTTEKSGVPELFGSMPPFIVAFIAGYGRDFIFLWMDDLLARLPRGRSEQPTRSTADTAERVEPAPAEPRLVQTSRAVGGN
jgi:hypothetical protein